MFPIPTCQFNGHRSKGNWQNLLQQEKVHQFFHFSQIHSRDPVGPTDPHTEGSLCIKDMILCMQPNV